MNPAVNIKPPSQSTRLSRRLRATVRDFTPTALRAKGTTVIPVNTQNATRHLKVETHMSVGPRNKRSRGYQLRMYRECHGGTDCVASTSTPPAPRPSALPNAIPPLQTVIKIERVVPGSIFSTMRPARRTPHVVDHSNQSMDEQDE
jgi:hypothetical protein